MFKLNLVFYKHVTELKLRFFYFFSSFIITFTTCYCYCFEIVYIFTKPFLRYKKNFIFTDITEFFYTNIEICFFFSFYFILPLFIYHIWCFFINSINKKNRNKISVFLFITIISLYGCILLVYSFLLPKLFEFLVEFTLNNSLLNIELQLRIKSYVSIAMKFFFFSSIFNVLPIIFFFSILSDVKNRNILRNICFSRIRNFSLILIIVSLFIPPDIFLQSVFSLFLYILLEIMLLLMFICIHFI